MGYSINRIRLYESSDIKVGSAQIVGFSLFFFLFMEAKNY